MPAFVTDTHPLIWYSSRKHARLSPRAVRIFDQAFAGRALIVIPAAALWEISLLVEHNRIQLRESFEQWTAALASRDGIDVAALGVDVIIESHHLRFHGDPFDRTIVATARVMDLPLITKDQRIIDSNLVEIAW
jgi:PIN domain nuclease of toxin-antitoxin system